MHLELRILLLLFLAVFFYAVGRLTRDNVDRGLCYGGGLVSLLYALFPQGVVFVLLGPP